jgi:hypothetical protein
MLRKEQAAELLNRGNSISQIAKTMGVTDNTIIPYLCSRVGEGAIRLSDIYFSWTKVQRELMGSFSPEKPPNFLDLEGQGITLGQYKLFLKFREGSVFREDMYGLVASLEVRIHQLVFDRLVLEYGTDHSEWWGEGVPLSIRQKCRCIQEEETNSNDEPFCYSTLMDLITIIDKNWALFDRFIPSNHNQKKKRFIGELKKLNFVRNQVMHPVKGNKWHEEDFLFVRGLAILFEQVNLNEPIQNEKKRCDR